MLTVSFAFTAITINFTFNKNEVLEFDAKTVETSLHKKERFVKDFLKGPGFDSLRTLNRNPVKATQLISEFRDIRNIYLYTYLNHGLTFWGSDKIVPLSDAGFKEGSNIIKTENGYYEAIRRTSGNFSVLAVIPIKAEYSFQNKYLRNVFSPDLIKDNHLEIANINDGNVYNINNIDGKYLFSVKLKSAVSNTFYSKLELLMWLLAVFLGTIFFNYLCISLAKKDRVKLAVCVFFLFFLALRVVTLEYHWLDSYFNISLFDSKHFKGGYLYPSLGDLLINAIMVSWFLCFVHSYRYQIFTFNKPFSKFVSIVILALAAIFLYFIAYQQNEIFKQLVSKSNINFDVTNILYLDAFSWLGIVLMCISLFNIYIILEDILVIGENLQLPNNQLFQIYLYGSGVAFILALALGVFNIFLVLFTVIILLRGWAFYNKNHEYKLAIFLVNLLLFSIVASIKLSGFQFSKERDQRKNIAYQLQAADDPNAVLLFFSLEQELLEERFLRQYFKAQPNDRKTLHNRLRNLFFDGYLSRYEIKIHSYSSSEKSFYDDDSTSLNSYKDLVLKGSIKVSEYFYRINNTFGFQNYFALLPVRDGNLNLGTLVIQLKAKTFQDPASFPQVLIDGKIEANSELNDYSFAFYHDGNLLSQKGDYNYNLVNTSSDNKTRGFSDYEINGFSHVLYQPTSNKVIIVSKPVTTWIMKLASVSFLFLVLITFSVIVVFFYQAWIIFHDDDFRLNDYNWNYLLSKNRVLYKTRIQASMVIAIIFTLLVVGSITYFSIGNQFRMQQEDDLLSHAGRINEALENNDSFSNRQLTVSESVINSFANLNATDLNLYDLQGRLVFSTQPKIYEQGLISARMNSLAFVYLNKYQRSEYLNNEKIGLMNFISAYKPIRNNNNETIGYLGLPDFSNQQDYEQRIGSFLNALINVYALVLVIIAMFAVFLANQITHPLSVVAKNLGEIALGKRHEPIKWKSNDEIGSLIQEYNKMIAALEESAQKLAKSERESAWREMAKQVAHEIKNPLTPLKLGVQLLDKSWKAKDPNFDKKFEKFSKSFIEQIDSLTLIASEFSNFAKMPDTPFENVNLNNIVQKTIDVFDLTEDLEIVFSKSVDDDVIVRGGKDHLLRIFNNLLKNAIEAIPDYRKGNIRINLGIDDKYAFIELSDNGKGIPDDLRGSIFNHNFTTKSSGSGLGLAFVKQAVENMYGTIEYETEVSKGTTFYIKLPLATS